MIEIPYLNANEDFCAGGCPLRAESGSAAGFALDGELQLQRVLQLDRGGADQAGVTVGRAEVRDVERALRAAAGERLGGDDAVVAHDLGAGADPLALRARDRRREGDAAAGPEEAERNRLQAARRERA